MSIGWQAAVASALHVLALAIGLPAIALRARALLAGDVVRAERADNAWGIAAVLWISTGLWRLLWLEKGWAFYAAHWAFHAKMGVLVVIGVLELWPMAVLLRWRARVAWAKRHDEPPPPDPSSVVALGWVSAVETAGLCIMPFLAAAMARALAPPFP